ncbi:MAG: hypothetical protein GF368_05860 [Candidatus Aenigmarchaeota archaeon]|nr:hypothetical protein [Candidatus Aenigmarchaeota archaeon]
MKESNLIKICLLAVFLGVILMFISTKMIGSEEVKIEDISEDSNYVKITGKIIQVSESKSGTTFLKLKDGTGSINAVIFKDSIKSLEKVKEGTVIEVTGKIEKYKGEMEILVNSIN